MQTSALHCCATERQTGLSDRVACLTTALLPVVPLLRYLCQTRSYSLSPCFNHTICTNLNAEVLHLAAKHCIGSALLVTLKTSNIVNLCCPAASNRIIDIPCNEATRLETNVPHVWKQTYTPNLVSRPTEADSTCCTLHQQEHRLIRVHPFPHVTKSGDVIKLVCQSKAQTFHPRLTVMLRCKVETNLCSWKAMRY
jgi:hypothetical protein